MVKPESNKLIVTPAWNGLKQQILHLAQFGGSIQVIQGRSGAGKTAFFLSLQADDLGSRFVGLTVTRGALADTFFFSLVEALGLRPDPAAKLGELIVSLRAYVQSQYAERARIVVAIDDVHLLGEPALAALISVLQGSTDSGVGLHLIFFSEPGIVSVIDSLNLLDITVHDAQLPTFSPSEVKSLIQGAFTESQSSLAITAEQVQAIWADSKGLPGEAIRLARSIQDGAKAPAPLWVIRGLPLVHFAALLMLVGVLCWVFVPRGDSSVEVVDAPVNKPLMIQRRTLGRQQELGLADRSVGVGKGLVVSESAPAGKVLEVKAGPYMKITRPMPKGLKGRDKVDEPELKVAALSVKVEAPEVNPIGAAKVDSVKVKPLQATPEVSSPPRVLHEDEQKLLMYTSTGFSLQVMALGDRDKIEAYRRSQPNSPNLLVYETVRKGSVIYILLEGFYADKQSALMAIVNLPNKQRKAGPWPKRLQTIHQEINSNRRR